MSKKTALIIGIFLIVISVVFRMLDNAGKINFDPEMTGFVFGFLISAGTILLIRGLFEKK